MCLLLWKDWQDVLEPFATFSFFFPRTHEVAAETCGYWLPVSLAHPRAFDSAQLGPKTHIHITENNVLISVHLSDDFVTGNIPQASAAAVLLTKSRQRERLYRDCLFSRCSYTLGLGRWEDICDTEPAGGHLLTGTGAAAVGVRFKVKPVRSNWRNNSRCPALEIRGSNRGVYFRQGYTKCSSLGDTCIFFFVLFSFSTASSRPTWARGIEQFFVFSVPSCQGRLGGDC